MLRSSLLDRFKSRITIYGYKDEKTKGFEIKNLMTFIKINMTPNKTEHHRDDCQVDPKMSSQLNVKRSQSNCVL